MLTWTKCNVGHIYREAVTVYREPAFRVNLEIRAAEDLVEGFAYAVFAKKKKVLLLAREVSFSGSVGNMKAKIEAEWKECKDRGELAVLRRLVLQPSKLEAEAEARADAIRKAMAEERAGKLLEERRAGSMPAAPEGGVLPVPGPEGESS